MNRSGEGSALDGEVLKEKILDEEVLHGGIANAGAVVRQGDHVLRPSNPNTPFIHAMLRYVAEQGFTGASRPIGVDPDGRERLEFIVGDVAIPPYPAWVQTNDALASIAALLREFHHAVRGFVPSRDATWSNEMQDPGPLADRTRLICHNDVCLENVVFRNGEAVGLLDFDFAAPGNPLYELAQFARMCVPVDTDEFAASLGWEPIDAATRLRVIADAYGLPPDRSEFLDVLATGVERGGQFVMRRVEAGDPNFIEMWKNMGGMARFDRRRDWFAVNRPRLAEALG
ncbi:MAG: phosphotransferase [Ilumatobacteraceae bacterium]